MSEFDKGQDQALRILAHQRRTLEEARETAGLVASASDEAIASSEALLRSLGLTPEMPRITGPRLLTPPPVRDWQEMLSEAEAHIPSDVDFQVILTPAEIALVVERHRELEAEFAQLHRLDAWDYAIAGVAGTLTALIDIFLVQVPQHPGFLGGEGHPGGWLSNVVNEKFGQILPPDAIRRLEKDFPVPFDPSTSKGLDTPVSGLGPRSHRFQSVGHDPLLAWIFGVRDVLQGEFTAIDKAGRLIIQAVPGAEPHMQGAHFFVRLFDAFRQVGGHLASDVATPAGLPAPLMPLLAFLQTGDIKGYTIGEIAKQMYRSGYDFRHFVAGSLPVMLIETIVRTGYFVRRLHQGASLKEALPIGRDPKLQTQLFLAHTVATAANAGKVAITQSPLSVSWAQWLAFFRYLLPQAHWVLIGREDERRRHFQAHIQAEWEVINTAMAETWASCFTTGRAIL